LHLLLVPAEQHPPVLEKDCSSGNLNQQQKEVFYEPDNKFWGHAYI
jgi:hypothetical protein